jgi:hypothetical protein
MTENKRKPRKIETDQERADRRKLAADWERHKSAGEDDAMDEMVRHSIRYRGA